MNILILQGSPRANGSTAWMAEAAEAAGIITAKIANLVEELVSR